MLCVYIELISTIAGNCKLRLECKKEWSYKVKNWKLSVCSLIIFCSEQAAFPVAYFHVLFESTGSLAVGHCDRQDAGIICCGVCKCKEVTLHSI